MASKKEYFNFKKKFPIDTIPKSKKLNLRQYQKDLIEKIEDKIAAGEKSIMLQSSPGSGKTLIMSYFANKYSNKGDYVFSIAHRQEIIRQTISRYLAQGANYDNFDVAMVQTVRSRVDNVRTPKLIIIDEAHHSMAATYLKVLKSIGDENTIKLYFTATPRRADGKGFLELIPEDNLIKGPTTKWLIDHDYLAHYQFYQPVLVNDDDLKFSKRSGDFTNKSIQETAKALKAEEVVKYYHQVGDDEQAIVYAATLEQSKRIVDAFNEAGIKAFHLDGTTNKDERDKQIEDYRKGKIRIISNVEIFTEGLDLPNAHVALITRPTMSLALYLQFSMRVLRPQPGKVAKIVDFAGNADRLGLPSQDYEWSLRPHDVTRTHDSSIISCPVCKRTFYKKEIKTQLKKPTEKRPLLEIDQYCPHCGELINHFEKEQEIEETFFDKDDELNGTEMLNSIKSVSDKKYFERYWLKKQEVNSSNSLNFNYKITRSKLFNENQDISQDPELVHEVIKETLRALYQMIFDISFSKSEVNDLIKTVNADGLDYDFNDFEDDEKVVKLEVQEEELLNSRISFENTIEVNTKIAKIQSSVANVPYYKILFDALAKSNESRFISLELTQELLNDQKAVDYYYQKRYDVSTKIVKENLYTFVDVEIGRSWSNKTPYIRMKFVNNKNKKHNIDAYAYRKMTDRLTYYAARDIVSVLIGNDYRHADVVKIQDITNFNQIVNILKKKLGNKYLIMDNKIVQF